RLEWISASEGDKVRVVINDMVSKVSKLGPLGMPDSFKSWDKELKIFEQTINEKEACEHV
ncbi:MAG: hydrogenase iron-sulfur subunit, partial [Bacteroidota bacterium]